MQNYAIVPLRSAGPALLGASRAEVQAVLGPNFQSFYKTPSSTHPTDAWHGGSFQVFYRGEPPVAEYIELSASPEFTVQLLGQSVFQIPVSQLVQAVEAVAAADLSDPEIGCSYVFPDLQLSFWRPDNELALFATIGIGRVGYYRGAA